MLRFSCPRGGSALLTRAGALGRVSAGRVEVRCPESPSDPRTASAAPAGSRAASVPWPQPWQSHVWFFFSFNVVHLGTHSTADRVLTRKSPWPWEPLVVQGFLQARVRDLRIVVPDSGGWSTRPDGVGLLGGGAAPFLEAPLFPRHLDIQGREEGGRWSLETRVVQMPARGGPVTTGPHSRFFLLFT